MWWYFKAKISKYESIFEAKISKCDGIFEAKLSKCDGIFVSFQGKGGKKMTISEIKKDLGNKVSFG